MEHDPSWARIPYLDQGEKESEGDGNWRRRPYVE